MTVPTALVMHPDCGRHDTGWGHPEHQGRLPAITRAVYRDAPQLLDSVLQRQARPAAPETLQRVHAAGHIERIRSAAERATRLGEPVFVDSDTAISAASWEAALAAAGSAITAAEIVLDGAAKTAFAAARPPGHHATRDRAMGFCLFNNVAVATRAAQQRTGVDRVLIVDWDVHHGNGTQQLFYEDPSVYLLSVHESPSYPGTGAADERGAGAGADTTRNVPLPAGTTGADYMPAFEDALGAALDVFRPDLVFVSAGFDSLADDPLGGFRLEPRDLHALTTLLADAVADSADGRIVAVLEGGYAPDRLGAGVVDVLRALAGLPPKD